MLSEYNLKGMQSQLEKKAFVAPIAKLLTKSIGRGLKSGLKTMKKLPKPMQGLAGSAIATSAVGTHAMTAGAPKMKPLRNLPRY